MCACRVSLDACIVPVHVRSSRLVARPGAEDGSVQVAEMMGYELASRQGSRSAPAEQATTPDIGEAEGRAVLQAAQRASSAAATSLTEAPAAPLPSFAELLRETPAGAEEAQPAGDAVRDAGEAGQPPGVEVAEERPGGDVFDAGGGEGTEELAREVQESQARGALRRELRRKMDLNVRDMDWGGGGAGYGAGTGWGYGGGATAPRRKLLTQAELDSLLSDTDESADSL